MVTYQAPQMIYWMNIISASRVLRNVLISVGRAEPTIRSTGRGTQWEWR
jgi:hypothetical protein